MTYLRSVAQKSLSIANPFHLTKTAVIRAAIVAFSAGLVCAGQQTPQDSQKQDSQSGQTQAEIKIATVTIPAGTEIPLVLTQPIQSRYVRHGDDIYAQVTAPVNSADEVVIPPGTFVQGKVDKLGRNGGRGELHLLSMSITFPDGYVAPISGPITVQSDEGYAIKDPSHGRMASAFALPFAGAGIGALIGHSVGSSTSTLTSSIPPGCNPAFPNCLSASMTVPGRQGIDTGIGAVVGGAVGGIGALVMLLSSHDFYLDAGAPIEMTLNQAVTLQQNEVAEAVRQSSQHPVPERPIAQRPQLPLSPPNSDHGTCYTPDTPGTPPTVIPGTPGPDGVPGPPTVIPGTPATPGTPYPCP
jgi:hypothetical protein